MSDEENDDYQTDPIQLVTESFDLETDGIEFLQLLKNKKISVITVIGPRCSGKSGFANKIVRTDDEDDSFEGFRINEDQSDCDNKGLYVWGTPIKLNDSYLIVIDVEGFTTDKEDSDALEYSTKLFALCNLISSYVIYVTCHSDDKAEEDIKNSFELFELYSEGLKKVKLEEDDYISDHPNGPVKEENNKIENKHIPNMLWLNNTNSDLENIVDVYKDLSKNYNVINELFDKKIKFMNINNENNQQIIDTKKFILDQIRPLTINNINFDGNMIYGVLQELCSPLSCGDFPVYYSCVRNTLYSSLSELTESVNETFKEKFQGKVEEANSINNTVQEDEESNNVTVYSKDINIIKNTFDLLKSPEEFFSKYSEGFIGKLFNSEYLIGEVGSVLAVVKEEMTTVLEENIKNYCEKIQQLIKEEELNTDNIKTKFDDDNDFKDNFMNFIETISNKINNELFEDNNYSFLYYIKKYLNNHVVKRLNNYFEIISKSFNTNSSQLEEAIKSKDQLIESIKQKLDIQENENIKLKSKYYDLETKISVSSQEYENKIAAERNRYTKLEGYYNNLSSTFKELEEKIANINKELSSARIELTEKNEKIAKMEKDLKNKNNNFNNDSNSKLGESLKYLYQNINKACIDYSDFVNKLEKNKNTIFKNKFIEQSIYENNENIKSTIEEIQDFNYKRVIEINDVLGNENKVLKEDKIKLKNDISKLENEIQELNVLNAKKDLELKSLSEGNLAKDNKKKSDLIEYFNQCISLSNDKIKRLENKIDDIAIKLSKASESSTTYSGDIKLIFDCLSSLCDNPKRYEEALKKISEGNKDIFKGIMTNYKKKLKIKY